MAYMLTTVEEVKSWQKAVYDNALDSLIRAIIFGITDRFATFCGREWDRKAYTHLFSPSGRSRHLWLPNTPILATPAIQVWQDELGIFAAETLVAATAYRLSRDIGRLTRLDGPWEQGYETVKVTYTGGYLTGHGTGAPHDLRQMATMQASFLLQRRAELGIASQSTEGGSITMQRDIDLLPEVKAGLQAHRANVRL